MNNKELLINMLSNATGLSHTYCETLIAGLKDDDIAEMINIIKARILTIDKAIAKSHEVKELEERLNIAEINNERIMNAIVEKQLGIVLVG